MPDYIDEPPEVLAALRAICLGLPEAYEESAWAGTRWRIRQRTFAHVRTVEGEHAAVTRLQFRSPEPEFEVLLSVGPPFFRAGWGTDVVNMTLDDDTDWTEVALLLAESYCVLAPKRLAALVHA